VGVGLETSQQQGEKLHCWSRETPKETHLRDALQVGLPDRRDAHQPRALQHLQRRRPLLGCQVRLRGAAAGAAGARPRRGGARGPPRRVVHPLRVLVCCVAGALLVAAVREEAAPRGSGGHVLLCGAAAAAAGGAAASETGVGAAVMAAQQLGMRCRVCKRPHVVALVLN